MSTNTDDQSVPNKPEDHTTNPEDTKQCRICLAGTEEELTSGRLIRPCLCKGSMQYVHVKCLNQWRMSSGSKSAFYKCETCHYSYAFARTKAVGLATSPIVLGVSSALLLTIIAFIASFFVVYFFPSLGTPSYTLKTRTISDIMVSPLTVANTIIGKSLRAYDRLTWSWWGYVDDWEEPIVDAYPLHRVNPKDVGFLEWMVHRILLGLSAIGSLSFVSLLWQSSLMGALRIRSFRNRGNRRETANKIAAILIIVFIVIGIGRAVRNLYRFNRDMAQRILVRLEDVILEVRGV
ncbi:hypothetical protein M422DRAFT_29667 [Sphaerobolus stellatus SS14]|uniref:RING-CH-type domain-containing protein n=1 Tax=Sphaerobolus stellatus (strain SS14) TaxID=990650 RepID=A0A0C9VSQ9_SPHS4|nr:hypothetical protein M422DRAFT_29667 [Sphaerobolus stellatus SS14]